MKMMLNNRILHNTVMLYLLTFAKMIFPLITLPYLTRVLSVESFGLVSFVKAFMTYLQVFIDFGFMLSATTEIVKDRDDTEKLGKVYSVALCAQLLLGIISFVFVLAVIPIVTLLQQNILFVLSSFFPVFLTCFLCDYIFRGLECMEVITIRFVIMKGIAALLTFTVVHSETDLLWIPVLESVATIIAVIWVQKEIRRFSIIFKLPKLSDVISKIKSSVIYFLSDAATLTFGALNTLLIGMFLSSEEVAYWAVCMQLVVGVQSLYTPLTNAIYPHMVKYKDFNIVKKSLKIYMPLVCVGCIFTYFVSKYILLIIAGKTYVTSEILLKALVPLMFFSFPAMLFGWPCVGAIGFPEKVTITTLTTAVVQVIGLVILIFIDKFTLVNIALFRGGTEILMLVLRVRYCYLYRHEFK